MKNISQSRYYTLVVLAFLYVLTGCTVHINKEISSRLDHEELNKSYRIVPTNLAALSKCEKPPTLKIVNIESRTDDFVALENGPVTGFVNPKELMDDIALYLKTGFKQSQVQVDDQSPKVLQISMIDLKSIAGFWSFGSDCKIELTIPETGLSKSYASQDNAVNGYTAAAYAIHTVTRKIIDDPVIQDYILCRTVPQQPQGGPSNDSLSKKFEELKTALDAGLISQEEYQAKRKAILERH